jgi:scyllo-inositol 2-dehydrogenase (NAD+)
MPRLRVGVVGVGEMGLRHAENLRHRIRNAQLVAVADVALERARQVAANLEIEKAYGTLEQMLEGAELDAVVVATPDKFHASTVKIAAGAGKAILCEKPLALSLLEGQDLLEAVCNAKVPFQVGFMRRYDPAYAAAMKRIEAGEIGTPVVFKSLGRDKEGPPLSSYHSNLNGMLFYTNTIHDFDLARWLMQDEVLEVHAYTSVAIRPEVAEFNDVVAAVVNLRFEDGAIGNVESYAQAVYGYDVRTEIVGSKGSILVGSHLRTQATFLNVNGSIRTTADHFLTTFEDAYLAEMQDFVDCVNEESTPRVTGLDGLKALAIAASAEASHQSGKPVPVNCKVSAREFAT